MLQVGSRNCIKRWSDLTTVIYIHTVSANRLVRWSLSKGIHKALLCYQSLFKKMLKAAEFFYESTASRNWARFPTPALFLKATWRLYQYLWECHIRRRYNPFITVFFRSVLTNVFYNETLRKGNSKVLKTVLLTVPFSILINGKEIIIPVCSSPMLNSM